MSAASARTLLRVDDLSILDGQDRVLVQNVSLSVDEGETVGVVGESGSGKSLTLRAIIGILPSTLHTTGSTTLTQTEPGAQAAAMVFQEPGLALNPTLRVGRLLQLTWKKHHPGCSDKEAKAAAIGLMSDVGIADPPSRFDAWPHELSGGMKQRIAIASALACEPGLLLCDEATTALDVRVQAQILALLQTLVTERGLGMLFVSHDLAVVSSVCERIIVMRNGVMLETGRTEDVLTRPQHEYTRALLDANLSRRMHAATLGEVMR
ncbi:ABC transporter ATP-binding protein [Microbacterium sp. 4R-513]|uniref:ABC transporter ATP-binding protein n=1 Tax=Microbacterium sp. 4R-513 TaxID=2567934 RepID=UPI0013E1BFC6|nr:ABC transporter ATP-binding protein [Microbacterium sp. 4R-513]QIG39492.1 ABC transporter ATP-binding protein [Microbacterium sp. 4R-513]